MLRSALCVPVMAELKDSRQSGAQETSAPSLALASCDCRQTMSAGDDEAGLVLPASSNQDVPSHV